MGPGELEHITREHIKNLKMPSRISKSISIGAQWSKEKLGMAKPSTFDADFLITEKTYKALEQLLHDLVKYIVIYLQPKSK